MLAFTKYSNALICDAKYPQVYGLSDSPCEAQRKAAAIGDWWSCFAEIVTELGIALETPFEILDIGVTSLDWNDGEDPRLARDLATVEVAY